MANVPVHPNERGAPGARPVRHRPKPPVLEAAPPPEQVAAGVPQIAAPSVSPQVGRERSPFVALGRIGRPHGLRGECRLFPYSEGATLRESTRLMIGLDWHPVEYVRAQGNHLIIKLRGIDTPEAAAALRHREVGLPREQLPPLAPGEFYWVDLIGLRCVSETRDFGTIVEVFEAGAQPILRARDEYGREELIPWVDAIVLAIEPSAGRVLVDWAGLD